MEVAKALAVMRAKDYAFPAFPAFPAFLLQAPAGSRSAKGAGREGRRVELAGWVRRVKGAAARPRGLWRPRRKARSPTARAEPAPSG